MKIPSTYKGWEITETKNHIIARKKGNKPLKYSQPPPGDKKKTLKSLRREIRAEEADR